MELAADILNELDSLQTPHVAYWAVVARRLAYPAYFQSDRSSRAPSRCKPKASKSRGEEQNEMLERLCRSIRGFISQSIGDSASLTSFRQPSPV